MTRKSTKNDTRRTSPLIWVKQVVLFRSISPVEEIRTVPFTPGLNIIQGKSDDSAEGFESGHGNGKTTLCRLIRYCLGEKTFGQGHVVEEVKHCFPNGYVGAVVVVGEDEWAVLRTVGHHKKEYAQQGGRLLELAKAENRQPYSQFLKRVQDVGLSRLQFREILSGGEVIQWQHVLALCSRDQESRYDRFWNVRPARSDSGFSKFTKANVSVCVRAMLGLLDSREPQIARRLDVLDTELPTLRERIREKAAEPTFHITQLRTRLVNEFEVRGADVAHFNPLQLGSIHQMRDARIGDLEAEKNEIEQKIADLDTMIDGATVKLNELHETLERTTVAKEITATGSAVLEESESLESRRNSLLEKRYYSCPTGELVENCETAKKKLTELEDEIAAKKRSDDQQQTLKMVQKRDQVEAGLGAQAKRQETPLEQIRASRKQLHDQKNGLLDRRRAVFDLLRVIPLVANDLLKWHRVERGEEPNQELTELRSEVTRREAEAEQLKQELSGLLAGQNERIRQFRQRFHAIVQQAINTAFKGVVAVVKDEIAFRISRERSLAGEAYETLAVLLADLALLIESSSESVCHPGLLIHDSPREADLNVRLYERMLDTAYSLMTDEQGNTPYQYIVTTTTAPSPALQRHGVLRVELSGGNGSLFGRQLETATSTEEPSLFDTAEGE